MRIIVETKDGEVYSYQTAHDEECVFPAIRDVPAVLSALNEATLFLLNALPFVATASASSKPRTVKH